MAERNFMLTARFQVLQWAALLSLAAVFYGGYYHSGSLVPIPAVSDANTKAVYTARCLLPPVLVLFFAIMKVAMMRFFGYSRNPLAGEAKEIQLDLNFLQNTLEQFAVFALSLLALMTYLEGEELRLVPLYSLNFVLSRVIYRIGYPDNRTWGFMMGYGGSALVLGLTTYFVLTRGFV